MAKIAIIGSGFSGLSASAYLAKEGHEVHVFEKNQHIGGRARKFNTDNGYMFDMGPSWYWMPDIFESFFADFNYKVADFYDLKLLSPSFDIVFGENNTMSVPQNFEELITLFEKTEIGAGKKLQSFMAEAEYKYNISVKELILKPGLSITEFIDTKIIKGVFKLQIFSSFSKYVRQHFTHPHLIALMEFPILFLGAMPQDTPALYSLMNYAGLKLGTWYPIGGFAKVIEGFEKVAVSNGVEIHTNANVEKINVEGNKATSLTVNGATIAFDAIIASADYEHVESKLLDEKYRNYDSNYWSKKTFAPSCLIFYIGVNKPVNNLEHHTLFFDESLDEHAIEIYKKPNWPNKPLFYVCAPSKTDKSVAPENHENLFLLMPLAPGLEDTEALREKYFNIMMDRLEHKLKQTIRPNIDYKKSYCINDFVMDYNAYKGNAYGLANTIMQTAILKPKIINKKVKNLFYTGQLTVPGPGVPPSILSGKIVANQLLKQL